MTPQQKIFALVASTLGVLTCGSASIAFPSADIAPQASKPSDPHAIASKIDEIIDDHLKSTAIPASGIADDAEFIRRLSLDIRGRVPTAERVASFLDDKSADKRAKLIDEFLDDSAYGEHFGRIWYHRMIKSDDNNRHALADNTLMDWLADQFNKNVPWNQVVTKLVTADGDRDKNPEITFWLAAIGDSKSGEPEPNKLTGAATRLFMGVRLECCECHDHPFTPLKQTDFWSTAAFFSQTKGISSSKGATKRGATPEIHENIENKVGKRKKKQAEEVASTPPPGSIAIPYLNDKIVQASFLGGESPKLPTKSPIRPVFAAWLTSPKNPYFSRALANKVWANFFGRGIVDPVDDMVSGSKNTHPEILAVLADEFARSGFDQKHLIRCLCNTRTYQRTSQPLAANKDDNELFSHMRLKVMSADVLYDSLQVVLAQESTSDKKRGNKNRKGNSREEFREFFHAEADDDLGIVEDYTHGVPQALRLMNSRSLTETTATVTKFVKAHESTAQVIESLYLTALARKPTDKEIAQGEKYVTDSPDNLAGFRDLFWAMLNSSEFMFNH